VETPVERLADLTLVTRSRSGVKRVGMHQWLAGARPAAQDQLQDHRALAS
jgi:hypothetical protein